LNHLKVTLPINLSVVERYWPYVEIVLLDYDSPDGLVEWVKKNCAASLDKKILRLYSSEIDLPCFHMSHAKNVVHKLAKGDILCNIDADNCIQDEFIEAVFEVFENNAKVIAHGEGSAAGKICVRKKDFFALRGYDESMVGWGWDDLDFIKRAIKLLEVEVVSLSIFDLYLRHTHQDRTRYNSSSILMNSWMKNGRYARANEYFKRYAVNFGKRWGELLVDNLF
jgi:predicted glycosyltransferase involved in capsule biosynthesis